MLLMLFSCIEDSTVSEKIEEMVGTTIGNSYKLFAYLLSMTGVWPKHNPSLSYKIRGCLSLILPNILGALILTDIFGGFGTQNREYFLYALFMFLAICLNNYEIFIPCYLNKNNFQHMLNCLNSDEFEVTDRKSRDILKRKLNISILIQIFYQSSFIILTICMKVVPDFSEGNTQQFDILNMANLYWIYWKLCFIIVGINVSCVDCLVVLTILIATAQLEMIQEKIKLIFTPEHEHGDEDINELLISCVIHQNATERFIEAVENSFTYMFLCYFFTASILVCIAIVNCLMVSVTSWPFITYLTLCILCTLKIYLYCLLGDLIINESRKVGDVCYKADWVNSGPTVRKTLCIIIQHSQHPVKLTAGKLIDLSNEKILSFLRTTYSYTAVLRQLYSQRDK